MRNCPAAFIGISQRYFRDLEEPVNFAGVDEQRLAKFREVRGAINGRVRGWLADRGIAVADSAAPA